MTVREFIGILQAMPQDAIVIQTYCSDFAKVEKEDISLIEPKDGEGLIDHHGHIMHLPKKWRDDQWTRRGFERLAMRSPQLGIPDYDPPLITAVHIKGN